MATIQTEGTHLTHSHAYQPTGHSEPREFTCLGWNMETKGVLLVPSMQLRCHSTSTTPVSWHFRITLQESRI